MHKNKSQSVDPFNSNEERLSEYSHDKIKRLYPDNNLIISRDLDGNVLSRYGDQVIDLTPYKTTRGTKSLLHFSRIIEDSYQQEMRWLWYICFKYGRGRNNNNLNVSVLYSRFIGFIMPLYEFAKLHKTPAIEVLETEKLLTKLIYTNKSALFNRQIVPVLKLYHSLSSQVGFTIAINKKQLKLVSERNRESVSCRKQTAIIPPRLYGLWLNEAWRVVNDFEKNSSKIINIINQIVETILLDKGTKPLKLEPKVWKQLIAENELIEFSKSVNFYSYKQKFSLYLSSVMQVCKGLIHFYSGMRDSEVLSLNYHCLSIDEVNHRKYARLIGNTTKYIGNKKQERWVTTNEIERVVSVLQSIAKPTSTLINVSLQQKVNKGDHPCPLFLTPNYLYSEFFRKKYPNGIARSWGSDEASALSSNSLLDSNLFIIEDEDVKYLEKLDPERNWRQSEYTIGRVWHFTTHQFRRSLAVYASQSGLVSIGSLQSQLKHLCQEVTFYYGNNAERAKNVFDISRKSHILYEFLREKPIADYTAWVWQILFSDEKLDGINGRVIERTIKADTPERKVLIHQDRKKTIQQFKDGQRAYCETPLGGCETTKPCNKKLMHSITACIDCEKADLKPSKVQKTIDSFTVFVESLPKDSIEYRTDQNELNQLIALKTRMENS